MQCDAMGRVRMVDALRRALCGIATIFLYKKHRSLKLDLVQVNECPVKFGLTMRVERDSIEVSTLSYCHLTHV